MAVSTWVTYDCAEGFAQWRLEPGAVSVQLMQISINLVVLGFATDGTWECKQFDEPDEVVAAFRRSGDDRRTELVVWWP